MSLEERIMEHEGFVPKIYKDTLGFATIGYGHLVKPTDVFKEGVEYPEEELYELFLKDLQEAKEGANTGVMKFAKMLLALEEKNYHEAHLQMLDSRWRKQTKKRCEALASIMKDCG